MCVTDLITNPLVPFPFAFARLNALQAAVDILTVWMSCVGRQPRYRTIPTMENLRSGSFSFPRN